MAQVPDYIIELIKKFISELEYNQIHIKKAILFGSYANGTFNEWSDIDLALVSDSFKGDRFKDRDLIRKIKLAVSSSLEPIPFRSENFTPKDPFVKSIIDSGLNVSLAE